MLAYEIQGSFGLKNLKRVELPDPAAESGQVVIKLSAASLNYRDWLMVNGHYNPKQPLPLIPLSDGVGVVEAVASDVDDVRIGQRVSGIFAQRWFGGEPDADVRKYTLGGPLPGMLAEKAAVNARGLVPVPDYLTDAEAATLPCAGVTAWAALFDRRSIKPGDTVLLQGTGGVSIFALQFAKLAGAKVMITSSSDEKLERCRQLGADYTVNYKQTLNWDKAALEWTDGRGVDLIVEVGGADTFGQSLRAIRLGGAISVIGILSGVKGEVDLVPILMKRLDVQGIFVGPKSTFESMNRALTASELRPVVDTVIPFDEAHSAFERMQKGEHFGKIVVSIP